MLNERLTAFNCLNIAHGPDVIRRNGCYSFQIVRSFKVWTRNGTPIRAIPVLCKSIIISAVSVISHGPHINCRDNCHAKDGTVVWTGNDAPVRAIPVLGECLSNTGAISIFSHGPYIIRRDDCYTFEAIVVCPDVWAGNNAPIAAIQCSISV